MPGCILREKLQFVSRIAINNYSKRCFKVLIKNFYGGKVFNFSDGAGEQFQILREIFTPEINKLRQLTAEFQILS